MINPLKAGVTFGALLGGYHLCWSLLVALGWAQTLIDFVFWMHHIQPVFVIRPFSLTAAASRFSSRCSGINCIAIKGSNRTVLFSGAAARAPSLDDQIRQKFFR
jgi:hypothetical protein